MKFCIYCGEKLETGDKFCPACGKRINTVETVNESVAKDSVAVERDTILEEPFTSMGAIQQLATKKKSFNKKTVVAGAIALVCIIVVLIVCLCGKDTPSTENENNNAATVHSVHDSYPDEINYVLNREMFLLKDTLPEAYVTVVNSIPYIENWTFRQILNEKNFENIEWRTKDDSDGKTITFTGNCTSLPYEATITIVFSAPNAADAPSAQKMDVVTDKETTIFSPQMFIDDGFDELNAYLLTDTSISSLIVFFAEDTFPSENADESIYIDDTMYMWEGRDVFCTFYGEYFAYSNATSWTHLGIKGDYYRKPGNNFTDWFDIYRVDFANTESKYYAIPYGEIQLTEVYEINPDGSLTSVWSMPLEEYYPWMKDYNPNSSTENQTHVQSTTPVPYIENIPDANQPIYTGPGYEYSYVQTVQVAGMYTIVEEVWDYEGNLWGKLKSGIGWIDLTDSRGIGNSSMPIAIEFANDGILSSRNCYEYVSDEDFSLVKLAITTDEVLGNVSFYYLPSGAFSTSFEGAELLYTIPGLTPTDAFVASVCFYGDMTAYGISFVDSSGMTRYFAISYYTGLTSGLSLKEISG